jgi:hypothetical protein
MKLLILISILVMLSCLGSYRRFNRVKDIDIDATCLQVWDETKKVFQSLEKITIKDDESVQLHLRDGSIHICWYDFKERTLKCDEEIMFVIKKAKKFHNEMKNGKITVNLAIKPTHNVQEKTHLFQCPTSNPDDAMEKEYTQIELKVKELFNRKYPDQEVKNLTRENVDKLLNNNESELDEILNVHPELKEYIHSFWSDTRRGCINLEDYVKALADDFVISSSPGDNIDISDKKKKGSYVAVDPSYRMSEVSLDDQPLLDNSLGDLINDAHSINLPTDGTSDNGIPNVNVLSDNSTPNSASVGLNTQNLYAEPKIPTLRKVLSAMCQSIKPGTCGKTLKTGAKIFAGGSIPIIFLILFGGYLYHTFSVPH